MLLAINFDEHFIKVKSITETVMITLQTCSEIVSEFYTPQTDRFVAGDYSSLCKEIFDISVTQVGAIVEPYSIGNDICGARSRGNR